MIESPSDNIQLTFEQLQQIDVFQKRLTNLDAEIFAASKNLQELRLDTERITKEKAYQEELLKDLNKKVADLEEKKSVLDSAVSSAEGILAEHTKKSDELRIEHGNHTSQMKEEKENMLLQKQNLEKEWSDISKEKAAIETDRKEIEAAREILSNAVKSIQWKSVAA